MNSSSDDSNTIDDLTERLIDLTSNETAKPEVNGLNKNNDDDEGDRICPSSAVVSPFAAARDLVWEDTFFDNDDDDVVAVFDFDYAKMESFYTKVGYALLAFPPFFLASLFGCIPCCLSNQIRWDVSSQHLAVTRDGIRFVRDKRKRLCGCQCTDAGRSSKTIPFDKITDCDIEEPAGATCVCVQNVLTTIHVDTPSSGATGEHGAVRHELSIRGLKDPHAFRKLVWALKRSSLSSATGNGMPQPPQAAAMDRTGTALNPEVSLLLREIRDELRLLNSANKELNQPATHIG